MFNTVIKILSSLIRTQMDKLGKDQKNLNYFIRAPPNTWTNVKIIECLWAEQEMVSKGFSFALCWAK